LTQSGANADSYRHKAFRSFHALLIFPENSSEVNILRCWNYK
jgi:hypothetical protein